MNGTWGNAYGVETFVITFSPLSAYTNQLFDYYPQKKVRESKRRERDRNEK